MLFFSLLRSAADEAAADAVPAAAAAAAAAAADAPAAAAAEPAAAAAEPAAASSGSSEDAPAAAAKQEEAAAPPPPPRKLTPEEVEAAKEELVREAVDKIVGAVAGDLLASEVVTAPYDPRFPSTNQSRHCFVRYNEYYKCVFERGAEAERCAFYKRAYESLCPEEWVEEWEELREKGLWMGKY